MRFLFIVAGERISKGLFDEVQMPGGLKIRARAPAYGNAIGYPLGILLDRVWRV